MILIPILFLFITNLNSESSPIDLNEIKSGKTLLIKKADFYYQKSVSQKIPNSNEELESGCTLSKQKSTCKGYTINSEIIDILSNTISPEEVTLKFNWTSKENRKKFGYEKGISLFRIKFKNIQADRYSLYQAKKVCWTSCNLWERRGDEFIFLGGSGKVSNDKNLHSPRFLQSMNFPFNGEEIYIEVANFYHSDSAMNELEVGLKSDTSKIIFKWEFFPLLLLGVLLNSIIYMFYLYINHDKIQYALYYSIFLFIVFSRVITHEGYLEIFWTDFPFLWRMRIEYITFLMPGIFYLLYLNYILDNQLNKILLFINISYLSIVSLMILTTQMEFFTEYLKLLELGFGLSGFSMGLETLLKSFRSKYSRDIQISARLNGLNNIFFISMFIIDSVSGIYYLTNIAFIIFSIIQSFIINRKSGKMWRLAEHLSINLQNEVTVRTRELSEQKELAESTLRNLQATQSQLIEAERMASLGQLVGGIAHEINNPIAVIHSHAELLKHNNSTTLKIVPEFLETLSLPEKTIFYEIVDQSIKNRIFLNSKEERKQRKDTEKMLLDSVEDENIRTTLSESLVHLRLPAPYEKYIEDLGAERFSKFLTMAEVFKNQSNSISSIEIAVEKASRVVFALRSYLNTELASSRKEIDLVKELEKALHVYDNYVMGKIIVHQEFPKELKYTCIADNIAQVWKNLFFNAIQAMYLTDKKLELKLEQVERIPESLKLYNTSSIVEESIFGKDFGKGWVMVSITDSGSGIPIELQEKVFTPFFTTKSLGEGIGLGLYTCKKIVHEHRGAMFFKSGEGSTEFVIILPL